jgi:hypothetical protein
MPKRMASEFTGLNDLMTFGWKVLRVFNRAGEAMD